jgi:hypothetical protein
LDVNEPSCVVIEVTVEDAVGQSACPVELWAVDDGTILDRETIDPERGSALLDPGDRTLVYIRGTYCALRIATSP